MSDAKERVVTGQASPAPLSISRVVEDHADFVWRSLRRLGVPPSQADDAAQEVFIVAANKIDRIEAGRERAFLFGVIMNVVAHVRRSFARAREVQGVDVGLTAVDAAPNPELTLADKQARALLDRVLDMLEEDLRVVFVLFELEEMTMADIADALNIPPGTVASRLRRAREDFHASAARVRREIGRTGGQP